MKKLGILLPILMLAGLSERGDAQNDKTAGAWTYDPQNPRAVCPSMPACGVWVEFRKAHPAPYQTFAIRENGAEDIVILSEPSPALAREQLAKTVKALFRDDLLELSYDRWPTGLDGWLEDVVLRVRAGGAAKEAVMSGASFKAWDASAGIVDRLKYLHRIIYHTTDGFWLDRLAGAEQPAVKGIEELKIPASDLASWLGDEKKIWLSASDPAGKKTTRELYKEKVAGVYSSDEGTVVLVAPKGIRLTDMTADFRRFAVASDLIVGAAGMNGGGMLLFGRSRQLPFATLPPLRFESFASFARNRSEHLAQSYERQRIFAGKIRTGPYAGWDWAPILLSSQLDDSEFGTLLNLADQVLKSWSQHGDVDYYAWGYPKPEKYPFGAVAASEYFEQKFLTTSLLFNWNTEGFATITTVNGRDVLTGDRTGALTVLYRPANSLGGSLSGEEQRFIQEEADMRAAATRDYFAARGDPLLVRVVQNVLLYQAVQSFLTVGDAQEPHRASRSDLVAAGLLKQATAWLQQIEAGRTESDQQVRVTLSKFMGTSGYTNQRMAEVLASPQTVERDLQRAYEHYRTTRDEARWMPGYLIEALGKAEGLFASACHSVDGNIEKTVKGEVCRWKVGFGLTEQEAFAKYDAYVAGVKKMEADLEATGAKLDSQAKELKALEDNYEKASAIAKQLSGKTGSVELDDVLRGVLATTAGLPTPGSIRTPSVVLSRNTLNVESIGGHNIDLVPGRRLIAPTFGEVKPRVYMNSEGRYVIPEAGKTGEPLVARTEAEAMQVRRKGSLLEEMRKASDKASEGKVARWTELQTKAKGCQCDAVVVQGEDGVVYFVRNAPPPVQQTILGKSGVIDALAGPPSLKVVRMEGFPDATAENIARSTAMIGESPKGSAFDRMVDGISNLFTPVEERGSSVSVTIERIGKAPEVLRISDESGAPFSFREPVSWKTSTLTSTTETQWKQAFGAQARFDPAVSDAVIIRFGAQPGTSPRLLGVQVEVARAVRPTISGKLRTAVQQWLVSQPLKPKPWGESVVELREAIRKQMKDSDLRFYYNHNKGKVRVAEIASPVGCWPHDLCPG